MENKKSFRRYKTTELLKMLADRQIRKGDIIALYSLSSDEIDYYCVTDKDIVMVADNETCLFDNLYLKDLITKWEFSVIFNEEEKQKIINQIKSEKS